ncbi:QUALITY PROTEIN: F-box WD repeat-containing 7-like [Octopus vulgaris]|uniref:QUALITY PROTEIN: F-box WD repeat-containing 7-like n=1 Tax=Octopus vulgaris TaxID=6645 RepID=A0AA36ALK6_OCTVU|nr:QUALITY PROTEIN: F-box WD repeat-containing 7-like [Octopus vulgaris]
MGVETSGHVGKVWRITRCRILHTLIGHTASVFAGDLSDTGSEAVTGSADKTIRIWNCHNGQCNRTIQLSKVDPIVAVSYSSDYIAYAHGSTVSVIHLTNNDSIFEHSEHKDSENPEKVLGDTTAVCEKRGGGGGGNSGGVWGCGGGNGGGD